MGCKCCKRGQEKELEEAIRAIEEAHRNLHPQVIIYSDIEIPGELSESQSSVSLQNVQPVLPPTNI